MKEICFDFYHGKSKFITFLFMPHNSARRGRFVYSFRHKTHGETKETHTRTSPGSLLDSTVRQLLKSSNFVYKIVSIFV
jgi:hypothetical protein